MLDELKKVVTKNRVFTEKPPGLEEPPLARLARAGGCLVLGTRLAA